jgi:hypothetical protein
MAQVGLALARDNILLVLSSSLLRMMIFSFSSSAALSANVKAMMFRGVSLDATPFFRRAVTRGESSSSER